MLFGVGHEYERALATVGVCDYLGLLDREPDELAAAITQASSLRAPRP